MDSSTEVTNILSALLLDPTLSPHHAAQIRLALEKLQSPEQQSMSGSPDRLTMSLLSMSQAHTKWTETTFADGLGHSRLYSLNPMSNDREGCRQEFLSFVDQGIPAMHLDDDKVISRPTFRQTHVLEDPQANFDALNDCALQSLVFVSNIGDPQLDIRSINDFNGNALSDSRRLFFTVAANVFAPYTLFSTLGLDLVRFYKFLVTVYESSDSSNPYHNALHAAEVLQAIHCFISQDRIKENFSDVEILAILLCAVCVDVGNCGVTNDFLSRIGHPIVQIFGMSSAQESAAVSFILHVLTQEDTNFFPTPTETLEVMNDRMMRLAFQELFTEIFVGSASHNHRVVLREVAEYFVNGVIVTQNIPKLLKAVFHICRFPHIFKETEANFASVSRFLAECLRQGDEERRRMLLISPLCDEQAGEMIAEAQRSLIQDVMLPLVTALTCVIPVQWVANLNASLDTFSKVVSGKIPPIEFEAPEYSRWTDLTHPVINSIRKIVRHAESLDRRASKVAILNATPQRKMTQSLETASAFSRVDHYYSFLRMFATFLQESRTFEDFSGHLIFLANQLDPTYIGLYAFSPKAEPSVETCREVGATIVESETAPSTSEVIASPIKKSRQSTDPFVLQLLAMYRSMAPIGSPNNRPSPPPEAIRRASWRAPPTNRLYATEPSKEVQAL